MSFLIPKIRTKVSWNGRELQVRVRRGIKAPLGRISGRVRMLARRQLKAQPARTARKNPSKPGDSPHTIFSRKHGGHRMRMILYAENRPLEWVVGTRLLGTKSKPTPSLHEHGGRKKCTYYHWYKQKSRPSTAAQRKAFRKLLQNGDPRVKAVYVASHAQKPTKRTKVVYYPKRPFMNPALRKVIPLIPQMLRNTVK